MASNTRCAGVVLLSLVALGFVGCAEDNESTAQAQGGKSTAAVKDMGPPPKDQKEYFERQKASGSGTTKANNYPGAK